MHIIIIFFTYFIFFWSPISIFAKTHVLLLDPGMSPTSNHVSFYNEIRLAYETAKSNGFNAKIFAKDGTWKVHNFKNSEQFHAISYTKEAKTSPHPNEEKIPSYPPINGPIKNITDVTKAIKSLNMKSGDSVLIFLTGHATGPAIFDATSSAQIAAWSEHFSYGRLEDELKKLPSDIKIKIASTTCHSGAIHYLSRKLPNVCSISSVSYQLPYMGTGGIFSASAFALGFWHHFKKVRGKDSFANMGIYALQKDITNFKVGGNLSSDDFIDYTLNKGSYDGKKLELYKHIIRIPQSYEDILPASSGTNINQYFIKNDEISYFPGFTYIDIENNLPLPDLETELSYDKETLCYSQNMASALTSLNELSSQLELLVNNAAKKTIDQKTMTPSDLRTIYHKVIDDMKENKDKYKDLATKYDQKYTQLKEKWNETKKTNPNWQNEGNNRNNIKSQYEKLKKEMLNDENFKRFLFNLEMLKKLARIKEFIESKKVTPTERRKYIQLLQCEWEVLSPS